MWVFKNKYFHMVSGWVDGVWIRALLIGCCVDGELYTQRQAAGGGGSQSNLRFVVIFLRLWDAVYTT